MSYRLSEFIFIFTEHMPICRLNYGQKPADFPANDVLYHKDSFIGWSEYKKGYF